MLSVNHHYDAFISNQHLQSPVPRATKRHIMILSGQVLEIVSVTTAGFSVGSFYGGFTYSVSNNMSWMQRIYRPNKLKDVHVTIIF